jgi:hypothetical protein
MVIKNKKGSVWENFTILIFFFVLFIGIVAIFIGYKSLSDALGTIEIESIPEYNQTRDRYITSEAESYPLYWDALLVVLFFGIWFIILILSWYTPNLTIFAVAYWLIAFILIIMGVFLSFSYTVILESAGLVNYTDYFPMTMWYFNWAWLIWILKIVSIGILLYANPGGGTGFD